jgi:lactobin A/cerein 7B family class IIb bacteriocin
MRELTMNEVQDVNGGFGWIIVAIAAALLAGCGQSESDKKAADDAFWAQQCQDPGNRGLTECTSRKK